MGKIKHIKPALYAMYYAHLKDIAEEYGYNLLIHGSMARDLDLLAVPWIEKPQPEQLMIADMQKYMLGVVTRNQSGMIPFSVLPPNRHGYTISLNRADRSGEWVRFVDSEFYLDISVVQF